MWGNPGFSIQVSGSKPWSKVVLLDKVRRMKYNNRAGLDAPGPLQDKATWPLGRVLQDLTRSIANSLGDPDPALGPDPETAFRQEWLPAVLDGLADGAP